MFPESVKRKDEVKEEPDEVIEIELFEEFSAVFSIYRTLVYYMRQYYEIPEVILSRLIDEENLPYKTTLDQVALIHNGFVSIMLGKGKENDR